MCPMGHYCPRGSYREEPCPPGRYAKERGTGSLETCLPCKLDTFQDKPGQKGCTPCGQTSQARSARGGATTCDCIGQFRVFQKTSGSCKCMPGYKPKDNKPDTDSIEDCELIQLGASCADNQAVDAYGRCRDKEQFKDFC